MKPLVRVTQLEKFRRWASDEHGYVTEDDVIAALTGTAPTPPRAAIGTAMHRIVETGRPEARHIDGGRAFDIDGREVMLDVPQCRAALTYRDEFPGALHEVREYADYGDIVVTGCADIINGFELRDLKTRFSTPRDDDYTDSAQWRMYLEMFGAETFCFDIFTFEGYDEARHGTDVRGLALRRQTPPVTCHYYDDLPDDNRRLIADFARWAKARGVWDKLPDAGKPWTYQANKRPQ